MVIAPLVWNISKLFVAPKGNDGGDIDQQHPQQVKLDAPAVRELKPAKKVVKPKGAPKAQQQQITKTPPSPLRKEAPPVVKNSKKGVRDKMGKESARNEKAPPVVKVSKAASQMKTSKKAKKNQTIA